MKLLFQTDCSTKGSTDDSEEAVFESLILKLLQLRFVEQGVIPPLRGGGEEAQEAPTFVGDNIGVKKNQQFV